MQFPVTSVYIKAGLKVEQKFMNPIILL